MPRSSLSKSELIRKIADTFDGDLTRKAVRDVIELLVSVGHAELQKKGVFTLPNLVRLVIVKKPATKERKGINPFTGQETIFKAKPARKVVKGRPLKATRDAIA